MASEDTVPPQLAAHLQEAAQACVVSTTLAKISAAGIDRLAESVESFEKVAQTARVYQTLLLQATAAGREFYAATQNVAALGIGVPGGTSDTCEALRTVVAGLQAGNDSREEVARALDEAVVAPLLSHLDEWKRQTARMEKDYVRETDQSRRDVAKANNESIKLQRKIKRGKGDTKLALEKALQNVSIRSQSFASSQKASAANILTTERARFCLLADAISTIVEEEVAHRKTLEGLETKARDLSETSEEPFEVTAKVRKILDDVQSSPGQNALAEAGGSRANGTPAAAMDAAPQSAKRSPAPARAPPKLRAEASAAVAVAAPAPPAPAAPPAPSAAPTASSPPPPPPPMPTSGSIPQYLATHGSPQAPAAGTAVAASEPAAEEAPLTVEERLIKSSVSREDIAKQASLAELLAKGPAANLHHVPSDEMSPLAKEEVASAKEERKHARTSSGSGSLTGSPERTGGKSPLRRSNSRLGGLRGGPPPPPPPEADDADDGDFPPPPPPPDGGPGADDEFLEAEPRERLPTLPPPPKSMDDLSVPPDWETSAAAGGPPSRAPPSGPPPSGPPPSGPPPSKPPPSGPPPSGPPPPVANKTVAAVKKERPPSVSPKPKKRPATAKRGSDNQTDGSEDEAPPPPPPSGHRIFM